MLYLFTADGLAVSLPVFRLSQTRELGGGDNWAVLTGLSRRAHLADALVIPPEATGYVFLTTLGGNCKRIRVEDLPGVTSEPFPVMNVAEDDALGWARLTTGEDEVILATASGQAIRFAESEVRDMGLRAGGVMAIRLEDLADGVVAMDLVRNGRLLWSITDNGLAKASPVDDYPLQGRYGKGVINVNLPAGAAEVVAAVGDEGVIVTTGLGRQNGEAGQGQDGGRRRPAPLIHSAAQRRRGVARSGRPTFAPEDEDAPVWNNCRFSSRAGLNSPVQAGEARAPSVR